MIIYHYDATTYVLLGSSEADAHPAEPGVFLIPAYATEIVPPIVPEGQQAMFDGEAWGLFPIPVPVDENITAAPKTLFGGPTMRECFNAQQ